MNKESSEYNFATIFCEVVFFLFMRREFKFSLKNSGIITNKVARATVERIS